MTDTVDMLRKYPFPTRAVAPDAHETSSPASTLNTPEPTAPAKEAGEVFYSPWRVQRRRNYATGFTTW